MQRSHKENAQVVEQRSHKEYAEVVELVLIRVPQYCQDLADYKYQDAAEALAPQFNQTRESDVDFCTAASAPLLLLAGCERLYMMMDYLADFRIGDMLSSVIEDLRTFREPILGDIIEEQSTSPNAHGVTQTWQFGTIEEIHQLAVGEDATGTMTAAGRSPEHRMVETRRIALALDVLDQLALFAEIRLKLADLHRKSLRADGDGGIDDRHINTLACTSEEKINQPMLRPLAELLRQELDVMRAAGRARQSAELQNTEAILSSLLVLRTAINVWNSPGAGELSTLRCRMVDILRSVAKRLPTLRRSHLDNAQARDACAILTGDSIGSRIHLPLMAELGTQPKHPVSRLTRPRLEPVAASSVIISYQCPRTLPRQGMVDGLDAALPGPAGPTSTDSQRGANFCRGNLDSRLETCAEVLIYGLF